MSLLTSFWIVSVLLVATFIRLIVVTFENIGLKDQIAAFDHDGDGRIGGFPRKAS